MKGPLPSEGGGRPIHILGWQLRQPNCLSPHPAAESPLTLPLSLCKKLNGPLLHAPEAPQAGPTPESRVPSRSQVSSPLSVTEGKVAACHQPV